MKKTILLLFILLIPINIFAYSNDIIPGGKTIGIEVKNDGVIVIGFYKIDNKFNKNNLKTGDIIIKVGNTPVNTVDELVLAIEETVIDNKVNFTIKRKNKVFSTVFNLILVNETYKTGIYVKDSITGIGTLSYIDPVTKIYGALGHEITESNTGNLIEVKTGSIFKNKIIRIDRSGVGTAGTKNAKFYSNTIFGTVTKNTNKGIYGIYTANISDLGTLEVGTPDTLKIGKASIYTVLSNEDIKSYDIYINMIDKTRDIKNIYFNITSEELIATAGGIIQGMSGSPIIQNNKIYGAVTHVILDNPTSGYGIFITTMLEEGER
ncbi:MAG: SpoIVB peptidase S55 domain-containing protein [Bacilli bacterium]|nr:SpoIVB peptidase S55 domain-containing protein [Bacilli bacterium]MDD3896038.1 SpoIVB peptidase S55 domain-containing protein [Bacilli bacterium]MDD4407908.1 SpoIVB peptidase S55 domain-containing protein [Bacilli bacterium]